MSHASGFPILLQHAYTEAEWATANPVLMDRETGWTTDTLRVKLGDGATAWNDLPFAADEAASVAAETVRAEAAETALLERVGLPTWVPADSTNPYDPKFNTYNFKPTNTRRLRAGLGRAAVDGTCEIVVVGDSSVTGCISVDTNPDLYDRLRAWPILMRDEIARHGVLVAGTGMVRIVDIQSQDARWTSTGTWVNQLSAASTTVNGATATFTTDQGGNRVTINLFNYAAPLNGVYDVHHNGNLLGTVTDVGADGWKQAEFTATITAGDTIRLTKVSGFAMTVACACVWANTGGMLVHNIGQGGSKAAGTSATPDRWNEAAGSDDLGVVYSLTQTTVSLGNPDCVFIELGGNDLTIGTTVADIVAALAVVRNRWPDSDCVLVCQWAVVTSLFSTATAETYAAALYELADSLDVPLIDQRVRYGLWTDIVARGQNGDTSAHVKPELTADIGRSVGQLVTT